MEEGDRSMPCSLITVSSGRPVLLTEFPLLGSRDAINNTTKKPPKEEISLEHNTAISKSSSEISMGNSEDEV